MSNPGGKSNRSGKRVLSREERWLWARVSNGYQPLKGRPAPFAPSPHAAVELPAAARLTAIMPATPVRPDALKALQNHHAGRKAAGQRPPDASRQAEAAKKLAPLAPLERKTLRAVRRGVQAVDGVIDLHGLRQTEAHYALLAFLRRSQARGAALVLVVTGKGASESGFHDGPDERGILKRVVPQWLAMPDARPFVISYGAAAAHHGGTGALYVRLRRQRS